MIRHIEFTIDFDLTCSAISKEDFGFEEDEIPKDNEYDYDEIEESIKNYLFDDVSDILNHIVIKKVWYEED